MTERSTDPLRCQHHHIDNATWECHECGTRMQTRHIEAATVLSAPNAASCTNPACVAALAAGTYDETNPPPGCSNPSGIYVADRSRERTVIIGWDCTYECDRCHTGGNTVFDHCGTTWGCGLAHRGARIRAQKRTHEGRSSTSSQVADH